MNKTFEVTFSVGNSSDTRWVTTRVQAFTYQQAQALVEAQYGSQCQIHSCYLID